MEEKLRMIRVLSLFSGIGAFEKALERLGVEHEVVNYCEIDPYAGKAYSLIHGIPQEKNLVDVTKVDTSKLENIDLVTYGFPCTDISIAGKMKGFEDEDGNTTRSGLFFEALRIIQDTKPKYAIAENVKNLMSKSFERELDIVLNSLGAAGYNNYCKVLNAKDYGIPQNRERVFIVSIRRDVDDFSFDFPKKETLELRMKDLLEKNVDEKYYMSDKALNSILSPGTKNFYLKPEIDLEVARPLTATMHKMHRAGADNYVSDVFINHDIKLDIEDGKAVIGKEIEPIRLGNIYGEDKGTGYAGNVWDKDAIAPTLMTMQGGNRQPMIIDDIYASREARVYEEYAPTLRASKCGDLKVAEPVIDKVDDKLEITYPDEPFVVASRGRYGENGKVEQHLEPNFDGLSNTLTTVQKDNYVCEPVKASDTSIIYVGNVNPSGRGMNGVVVDANGLARTIATEKGEGQKILIKENTKQGFAEAYEGDSINLEQPNSKTRRGRVGHGVAQTLTTSPQQAVVIKDECKPRLVGGIGEKKLGNQYRQGDRIYDSNAIAMCLTAQPVGNAGGNSYLYAVEEPKIEVVGNYMPSGHDASRVVDANGLDPTVRENHGTVTAVLEEPKFRIRKLTPKECFRLMGFDDKDIDILIENGISNTQLYKMAGNSIVVDVLERLFECLLLKKKEEPDLFSMMFEM